MIKKMGLSKLVEDFTLYPRNRVDDTHVNDLTRALRSGVELPPIIVDKKTLRLVDGFHRRRAWLKHLGPDAVAAVELRTYKTDAELFLDAVALNAHHGRKLDRHDQTRIVTILRDLHVDDATIAVTLHLPEPEIQTLAVNVLYGPGGESHPVKRGLSHLRGKQISTDQIAVMESVRSGEAGRLCMELIRLLNYDLVDLADETTVGRLRTLHAAIDRVLHAVAA